MAEPPIQLPDLPEEASHAHFRRFYEYWRAAAPPGLLPGRQHIDPLVDLTSLIPGIVLYDVVSDPSGLRFRVRLAGEMLVKIIGKNPAGSFIEDFIIQDRRARLVSAFREVAVHRVAHYWENQMWTEEHHHIRMMRLAMPLARDGRTVDMVIALHVRTEIPSLPVKET